jgi:glycosyltransferase involved in cell wall biosynthesis
MGREFFAGRYTIGQWAWELEEFPDRYLPSLDLVDEVWALSKFNRDAIAALTDKPVHVVPLTVTEPTNVQAPSRASLGLPDRFTFLFCFDMFSVMERKNPLGLIDAFSRAFDDGEGPVLVIKALNGDKRLNDREHLRWEAQKRSDVILIDRYLHHDEQVGLMSLADAYVSLHRSEGFGLTMAEAMALGKPVIATAYSGNLDFMTEDNSFLVPWEFGEVPVGCYPYPAGWRWADPDLDAAADILREVASDPAASMAVGARGRTSIFATHRLEVGAATVSRLLGDIRVRRAASTGDSAPEPRTVPRPGSS